MNRRTRVRIPDLNPRHIGAEVTIRFSGQVITGVLSDFEHSKSSGWTQLYLGGMHIAIKQDGTAVVTK